MRTTDFFPVPNADNLPAAAAETEKPTALRNILLSIIVWLLSKARGTPRFDTSDHNISGSQSRKVYWTTSLIRDSDNKERHRLKRGPNDTVRSRVSRWHSHHHQPLYSAGPAVCIC